MCSHVSVTLTVLNADRSVSLLCHYPPDAFSGTILLSTGSAWRQLSWRIAFLKPVVALAQLLLNSSPAKASGQSYICIFKMAFCQQWIKAKIVGPVSTISAACRAAGVEAISALQYGPLREWCVATQFEFTQLIVLLAVFSHGERAERPWHLPHAVSGWQRPWGSAGWVVPNFILADLFQVPGMIFQEKRTRSCNYSAFWQMLLELFGQCQSDSFAASNSGVRNFIAKHVRSSALCGVQKKVTYTKSCHAIFKWPWSIMG